MNERFTYSGSATISGMQIPNVRLQEGKEGEMRYWDGSATFPADETPEGFPGDLNGPQSVPIELPDGRTGQVLVTNVAFNGAHWMVDLMGTGPAPS
jgi:hypothetical protein